MDIPCSWWSQGGHGTGSSSSGRGDCNSYNTIDHSIAFFRLVVQLDCDHLPFTLCACAFSVLTCKRDSIISNADLNTCLLLESIATYLTLLTVVGVNNGSVASGGSV